MRTLIKSALTLIMALTVTAAMAQPRQRAGNATPEQRAKNRTEMLTKELELTDKQQKEVYDLYLKMDNERPEFGKRNANPTEEQKEAMKAEMNKRHEKMQADMKKILSADQYAKWEANRADRMKNMQNFGQGRKEGKNIQNPNCDCKNCNKNCKNCTNCPKQKKNRRN